MPDFPLITSSAGIVFVARLAREIWTEHYVGIIGQAQVDYMLATFQSADAIGEQIASGYEYYLITQDSQPAGYLAVVSEAGSTRLMLSKIYVRCDLRGMGLGKAAIQFVEQLCRQRGLTTIWLTVNRHNAQSIAWYERMGFRKTGEKVTDIGGGFAMDDFVMEKDSARPD